MQLRKVRDVGAGTGSVRVRLIVAFLISYGFFEPEHHLGVDGSPVPMCKFSEPRQERLRHADQARDDLFFRHAAS